MKTSTKIAISLLSILYGITLMAQNEVDALRYSRLLHGGTARYMSMGGAFSTLGADFSALSTNPAAIGVYKNSELMFTPSLGYNTTESSFLGTKAEEFKYNFNFTNLGMVIVKELGKPTNENPEWKGIQFGIGVNRLANFNNRTLISGQNMNGTILDAYFSAAQGIPHNQLNAFDTELAFYTYLLDTVGAPNNYIQAHYGGATQRKSINTSGGIDEMIVTLGGNYNDKLYIGATFGFPYISYEALSSHSEIDETDTIPEFNSLTISDKLTTTGRGFNFKLGFIYRATDWARISAAFHTPTFFSMNDQWSRKMNSDFSSGKHSAESPIGGFDYNLMTPMRVMGGVAFIIANRASISAEYELVDYSESRLREKNINEDFFSQNEAIREAFTAAGNLRVGAEYVIQPFRLRVGYALYGNPFKAGLNDATEQMISAGVGIREKNYFIDFGYVNSTVKSDFYLYPRVAEAAKITKIRHMIVCTVGFRF